MIAYDLLHCPVALEIILLTRPPPILRLMICLLIGRFYTYVPNSNIPICIVHCLCEWMTLQHMIWCCISLSMCLASRNIVETMVIVPSDMCKRNT